MKINQLFVSIVDEDTVLSLLKCVNITGFDDNRTFNKNEMRSSESVKKFETDVLSRLEKYYIPCKAKIYLRDVTENKLITIIKQVLKLYNYVLISIEKNKNNKKYTSYKLSKRDTSITIVSNTVTFD